MFTLNMVGEQLRESCSRISVKTEYDCGITNIVLLYPGEKALLPGTLYVGTGEVLAEALDGWDKVTGRMIIVSGDISALSGMLKEEALSYLLSDLEVNRIGNLLMKEFFQYQQWCESVRSDICQKRELPALLRKMAERVHYPILWLNSGYRLIASDVSYSFEDKYISELIYSGTLTSSSVDAMLQKSKRISLQIRGNHGNINAFESFLDTGHYAVVCEMRECHAFLGQIMMISDQEERDGRLIDDVRTLAPFFLQYASMTRGGEYFETSDGYGDLLEDLLEHRLKNKAELVSRTSRLSPPMTPWYRCAVLGFEAEFEIRQERSFLQKLTGAIPRSVVTRYEDEVIVLIRKETSGAPEFDEEELKNLLHRYHACLCLGAQSEFLTSFPAIFRQTRAALRLGMSMEGSELRPIFRAEEYHMYQIIDLCAQYGSNYHGGNLIYLCTPGYSALHRYDLEHHDNLCAIIEAYILNNCNTSQTAKALYLHRNTLINKLARIEEITGVSLDDALGRYRLMFSAMVMKYMEVCRHEDPYDLKYSWNNQEHH
ncbi:MAG: helix-turn-helix domain-containing protein [Clostridiales bacterium]|nr:helix-turn-helix domain-containing protein [Clostridiales bacterium]